MSKLLTSILGTATVVLTIASSAQANTIVKFGLSETAMGDVQFVGGFFTTVDDGDATTIGDQNTKLTFVGPLEFLADLNTATASFTLSGVAAVGSPSVGIVTSQATSGGTFSLYDPSNVLLLSGTLTDGAIVGGSSDTGSFFNTTFATYNAGSLLAYISPSPASFSLALSAIMSNGTSGLVVNETLQPFTADASGLLTGTEVPEPATLGLLMTGIIGAAKLRRKRRELATV